MGQILDKCCNKPLDAYEERRRRFEQRNEKRSPQWRLQSLNSIEGIHSVNPSTSHVAPVLTMGELIQINQKEKNKRRNSTSSSGGSMPHSRRQSNASEHSRRASKRQPSITKSSTQLSRSSPVVSSALRTPSPIVFDTRVSDIDSSSDSCDNNENEEDDGSNREWPPPMDVPSNQYVSTLIEGPKYGDATTTTQANNNNNTHRDNVNTNNDDAYHDSSTINNTENDNNNTDNSNHSPEITNGKNSANIDDPTIPNPKPPLDRRVSVFAMKRRSHTPNASNPLSRTTATTTHRKSRAMSPFPIASITSARDVSPVPSDVARPVNHTSSLSPFARKRRPSQSDTTLLNANPNIITHRTSTTTANNNNLKDNKDNKDNKDSKDNKNSKDSNVEVSPFLRHRRSSIPKQIKTPIGTPVDWDDAHSTNNIHDESFQNVNSDFFMYKNKISMPKLQLDTSDKDGDIEDRHGRSSAQSSRPSSQHSFRFKNNQSHSKSRSSSRERNNTKDSINNNNGSNNNTEDISTKMNSSHSGSRRLPALTVNNSSFRIPSNSLPHSLSPTSSDILTSLQRLSQRRLSLQSNHST